MEHSQVEYSKTPTYPRQLGGVEREKDSHGRSNIQILTDPLKGPDITPSVRKQLGGNNVEDP